MLTRIYDWIDSGRAPTVVRWIDAGVRKYRTRLALRRFFARLS